MKKLLAVFIISAMLMVSVAGCRTRDNVGEYPVTIGHTVFSSAPERTVVLSDSIADVILACGYSASLVARSEDCTQPELKILQTVGTKSSPNVDMIIAIDADLVIADDDIPQESKSVLTSSGIDVLTMAEASTRDELTSLYSKISSVFGGNNTGGEKGRKKAENTFLAVDDMSRQIPDNNVLKTACYIYDINGDICRVVSGKEFGSKLIEYTKASNIASGIKDDTLDASSLKLQNPMYIFCDTGVKEKLKENDTLKSLDAVKSGNVFELPSYYMTRQGNTVLETVNFIVSSMYPDLAAPSSDTDKSADTNADTDTSVDTSASVKPVKYRVNSDTGLYLRKEPNGEILLSLKDKQTVTVIDTSNSEWYKVVLDDGTETEGYCGAQFLVKVE